MGTRRPKNLLLDIHVLNRAESYCKHHETTLSRLVEDFLEALPDTGSSLPRRDAKSPIVQRLVGAAGSAPFEPDAYRDYLYRHYRDRELEAEMRNRDKEFRRDLRTHL